MATTENCFQQTPYIPTGTYLITNVRHNMSIKLPPRRDELCGSPNPRFKWKVINDVNERWHIQGGNGPWYVHRRPAPRVGNPIIASRSPFEWGIGQCHGIKDPDCYLIYPISDHTLLWGLTDVEEGTTVTLSTGEKNKKNWWRFERIPDDEPDLNPDPLDGRFILVMGATGSGKSSFINDLTSEKLSVSHDLDSCTERVQTKEILLDGQRVILIDMPGFGHSNPNLSDTEVLRLIAEYLANLYLKEIKLSGLLYMHRISDPKVDSQARHYFKNFQKLCGSTNLDHVVVVTTRWNDVKDGDAKENRLKVGLFKPVLDAKGRMIRHETVDTAKAILYPMLKIDARVLNIQSQMVDDGKQLLATDAGLELPRDVELQESDRGFRKWLRKLLRFLVV